MTDDDAELVRRYQRGDAGAFDAFVARHQHRVYRLARMWLRQPSEAKDVVQEVFVRSLGGLTGFRFRADPKTWLYRLTRNVCREFNRRSVRTVSLEALQEADTTDGEPYCHSAELLVRNDFGEFENDAPVLRRLHAALAALPARQREVTVLRVFEELSVAETARALACREGTVKAHLFKALANLRAALSADDKNIAREGARG